MTSREIEIPAGGVRLQGTLALPENVRGLVVFAHGSGSSRYSPRNRWVAARLQEAGLGTLLFDLLSREEEIRDEVTAELRFNIPLLARRLVEVTRWVVGRPECRLLAIGYFGASTGAAAALVAAAGVPQVEAIVSRGGRPDLAGPALASTRAATLLIVGGKDPAVIALNQTALAQLAAPVKHLVIVPGATHLFEEAGALDEVARLAVRWFSQHLRGASRHERPAA